MAVVIVLDLDAFCTRGNPNMANGLIGNSARGERQVEDEQCERLILVEDIIRQHPRPASSQGLTPRDPNDGEILPELVLRHDKQELNLLEQRQEASSNFCDPKNIGLLSRGEGRQRLDPSLPEKASDRNITEEYSVDSPQQGKFLMELLQLKNSLDLTVPLHIPPLQPVNSRSSLPSFKSNGENASTNEFRFEGNILKTGGKSEIYTTSNDVFKNDLQSLDYPLHIPGSWKRQDYSRRTLPELEHHIMHTSSGRGNVNPSLRNDTGKEQECTSYALFTILYNECSLFAMANWAMLDCPLHNESSITADEKSRQWEEVKKKHKRLHANRTMKLEFPPPMFHLCGVCRGFGHYEVECELLQSGGGYHQRMNLEYSQCNGFSGQMKRKAFDGLHASGRVMLDETERTTIISKLSKEIAMQRNRNARYYVRETNVNNHVNGGAVLAASISSVSQEDQHTGKRPSCMICRNRTNVDVEMISCDGCDEAFHLKCVYPPLSITLKGKWFCTSCQSHDSDAISVTVIDGWGEIEQRKCSVEVGSNIHSYFGLPADETYVTKHLERLHGHISDDFFLGELCWVERLNDCLNLGGWWPACITDCRGNTCTVKFFAVGETSGDKGKNQIRPYLFHFEDLGYKPFFMKRDDANHGAFRQALIESVSMLGLKSLGQALQLARCNLQMTSRKTKHHSTTSTGWEYAEIDRVDGIEIMAKGIGKTPHPTLSGKNDEYHDIPPDLNSNGCITSSDKMVAQFTVNEILGSIVSWQSTLGYFPISSGGQMVDAQYGVVVSVDVAKRAALVRSIHSNDALRHHNANESHIVVAADNVGSPTWIPLKHVRFVCNNVVSIGSGKKSHLAL